MMGTRGLTFPPLPSTRRGYVGHVSLERRALHMTMTRGDGDSAASTDVDTDGVVFQELGLTPVLAKYSKALRSVTDDKLRYQQLLFLAAKCEGMPADLKTDQNKVTWVL